MAAGQDNSNLHATLAISQEEAWAGTSRVLSLPNGRTVTVVVPAGVRTGQEIRLEGLGLARPDGYMGALLLTITILAAQHGTGNTQIEDAMPTMSTPSPFTPTVRAVPPSYPGISTSQPGISSNETYTPSAPMTPPPPPPPMYNEQGATLQASSSSPYAQTQPQYGQPYTQPPLAPAPAPAPRPKPRSRLATIVLLVVALLIIVGGISLYTSVYLPLQQQAQATAVAIAHVTGTASAQANATSQALATQQAFINATATTQAQLSQQATATVTARQTSYTQTISSNPTLSDSLSTADTYNWDTGSNCFYNGGAYHIKTSQTNIVLYCAAQNTNFSNFVYRVQMTIVSGTYGGLIFRADSQNSRFYLFRVGQDGSYTLYSYVDSTGGHAKTLTSGTASSIHTGYNQSNQIAVQASGNEIDLYINDTYIDSVSDATLQSGQIGVIADGNSTAPEVTYNNAQVWKI